MMGFNLVGCQNGCMGARGVYYSDNPSEILYIHTTIGITSLPNVVHGLLRAPWPGHELQKQGPQLQTACTSYIE